MRLYAGSSGFSYKQWKGPFYPEKLPPAQMLEFYAERLTSVEINNTFYRMPSKKLLEGWASKVPDRFRFAIKATRRITHSKKLKDCEEEMQFFVGALQTLGNHLGPVLFQLPPNFLIDLERLDTFLKLIPTPMQAAFEFRHDSWVNDEVAQRLATSKHTLVWADTDKTDRQHWPAAGDWFYLRLRREGYDETQLQGWLERLRAANAREAFVFFKHEDEGAAPALAKQLNDLAEQG